MMQRCHANEFRALPDHAWDIQVLLETQPFRLLITDDMQRAAHCVGLPQHVDCELMPGSLEFRVTFEQGKVYIQVPDIRAAFSLIDTERPSFVTRLLGIGNSPGQGKPIKFKRYTEALQVDREQPYTNSPHVNPNPRITVSEYGRSIEINADVINEINHDYRADRMIVSAADMNAAWDRMVEDYQARGLPIPSRPEELRSPVYTYCRCGHSSTTAPVIITCDRCGDRFQHVRNWIPDIPHPQPSSSGGSWDPKERPRRSTPGGKPRCFDCPRINLEGEVYTSKNGQYHLCPACFAYRKKLGRAKEVTA